MARRKFTREFKISAVKLVNEQGYAVAEAARSLGVDRNSVADWVEKYSSEAGLEPSGEGAMAAELRRLRKENARLLVEREPMSIARIFIAGSPCAGRSLGDPRDQPVFNWDYDPVSDRPPGDPASWFLGDIGGEGKRAVGSRSFCH